MLSRRCLLSNISLGLATIATGMTFEETDNHALNTYDQGDTGWEHSTDMETIEQRLVVRDLEANRTNYTAYDDATFIASDTGAVYDGDGASWNKATRGLSSLHADELNNALVARSSSRIESLINNASAGDTIRIAPGTYTGVSDLVVPSNGVTVIAYGATIVADSAGISGSPSRWPDFNGQNEVKFFGGYWDANPTDGDPPVDGVADYGFANSGGTIEGSRVQDVTVTGFASFGIRPRNWSDGTVSDCRAEDIETAFCPVLNSHCTFKGLTAHTFGDTYILADRNDNCSFIGGAAIGDPTGCTHGIDAPSNTDCRFEGMTIDGAGDATDGVNVRDDAGTPSTGCVFDVNVRNVVSFGARVQSGASHDVVIDGHYAGMDVGVSVEGGHAEVRATIEDTNAEGIRTPSSSATINGAVVRNPGSTGVSVEDGDILSVHSEGSPGGSVDVLTVSGVTVESISPSLVTRGTTNASGQINLDWSGRAAFGDKPQLSVVLEQAGEWFVSDWVTDGNGRYTTAEITITDSGGTEVGSGIQFNGRVDGV